RPEVAALEGAVAGGQVEAAPGLPLAAVALEAIPLQDRSGRLLEEPHPLGRRGRLPGRRGPGGEESHGDEQAEARHGAASLLASGGGPSGVRPMLNLTAC